eukprot:Skav219030  [mRNA]  locus=scaffold2722:82611:82841:- [translate_table: standard]
MQHYPRSIGVATFANIFHILHPQSRPSSARARIRSPRAHSYDSFAPSTFRFSSLDVIYKAQTSVEARRVQQAHDKT